jgi:hypothetical protein
MVPFPYSRRAASRLCAWQRILQFATVSSPPRPRGVTWSISGRTVEPQMPPSCVGHWHLPPSRLTTSRFTFAGTRAFRLACFTRRSSSAAVSTCSSVAPGCTCDWPAFAFFSSATNPGETVRWMRVAVEDSGSIWVRGGVARGSAGSGDPSSRVELDRTPASRSSTVELACVRPGTTGTSVTTVLRGTTSRGAISAATCFASARERWKKRGSTSARFSTVITRASSTTVVRQRRPSRIGSTTSGNRWTRRTATCR